MEPTAKILVIDDDMGIRFALREMLARDGYHVETAASGEEALRRIDEESFDVVLVDLKLQGIGGMEVLAEVRRRSPDTSVIVLTGYASLESAVEALRHGAHDYLFKPCKTVQLRESVRAALLKQQRERRQREVLHQLERHLTRSLEEIRATVVRARPTSAHTTSEGEEHTVGEGRFLKRGTLLVDFARHIITLDGHLLELSPTEFDLLAYLISEAPRVVPAQELVREVQGYDSEPWEARETVRYHIYRLRQKIREATGRTGIIRTVRGVGYTLNEGESP